MNVCMSSDVCTSVCMCMYAGYVRVCVCVWQSNKFRSEKQQHTRPTNQSINQTYNEPIKDSLEIVAIFL